MSNRMSQKEFSESLDKRLSGLQDDPWLEARVLAKAEGEKPVKKKLPAATIVVVVLLVLAMAGAVAAANWSVISRLFGNGWYYNEEAIEEPLKTECDLKMMRIQAKEAYWAEDGMTVVLKVECTAPDCLPYYEEGEHPEKIEFNGKSVTQDELRGDKNLVSCTVWCPGRDSWDWYEYTDEGLFIISTIMNPDAAKLEQGTVLTYQCYCENLQTGETEDGTIRVEVPAMSMQEGYFHGKE